MSLGKRGFSLLQMLTVVGIIIFVAAFILIAADPKRRQAQARDAQRLIAVNAVLRAVLQKEADDRVNFAGETSAPILADDTYAQVIVIDDGGIDCSNPNQRPGCGQALSAAAGNGCVANFGGSASGKLVPTYIEEIPVDPRGSDQVPACSTASDCAFKGNLFYGNRNSGYYIHKFTSGRVEIGVCRPERSAAISVSSGPAPR